MTLPLVVSGNRLVTAATGAPVVLRGVNRSGLEYSRPGPDGFLEAARMSEAEADEIVVRWRATIVRVPINQDWILNGCGDRSPEDYASELDMLVSWYATRGAYVLFDLHWLDDNRGFGANRDGSINRVPALPDLESPRALTQLAARYRDEPAVLFEIFNEPHTPISDPMRPERNDRNMPLAWQPDGSLANHAGHITMSEWKPWARLLVEAIQGVHPEAVIFVPGVDWAYDLRGMPLDEPADSLAARTNIVYTTHVYSRRRPDTIRRWHSRRRSIGWDQAFGALAGQAPVFVSEWGRDDAATGWGPQLVEYLGQLGIGWTAWSWSDRPRLVRNAQLGDYTPTAFGELVRAALTSS